MHKKSPALSIFNISKRSCSTKEDSHLIISRPTCPSPSSKPKEKLKSLTPHSHKSFSKIFKIEAPLDPFFESKINTRIKNFHENSVKTAHLEISLQKKLEEWENLKNKLLEDFQVRLDLRSKSGKAKRQQILHDSDEEDFNYSYKSRIGKLRKLNSSLIKVSEHPNTYGANSISLVKQVNCLSPNQNFPRFKASLSETFQMKLSLARKRVRVDLKDIENSIDREIGKSLPYGGEALLRLKNLSKL